MRINKNSPLEWNGALALALNPALPRLPDVPCPTIVRVGIVVGIEKNHLALILINTNNQLLKQAKNRQLYIYVKHEEIFYEKAILAPVTFPNLVLGETTVMNPGKSRANYS